MRSLLPFKNARGYALGSEHCIRASTGDSLRGATVAFACQKDRGAVSRSIVQASGLLIPNLANSRNPEIQRCNRSVRRIQPWNLQLELDGYLFWHRSRSRRRLGWSRSASLRFSACLDLHAISASLGHPKFRRLCRRPHADTHYLVVFFNSLRWALSPEIPLKPHGRKLLPVNRFFLLRRSNGCACATERPRARAAGAVVRVLTYQRFRSQVGAERRHTRHRSPPHRSLEDSVRKLHSAAANKTSLLVTMERWGDVLIPVLHDTWRVCGNPGNPVLARLEAYQRRPSVASRTQTAREGGRIRRRELGASKCLLVSPLMRLFRRPFPLRFIHCRQGN
jgi:hypothetical protein